MERALYISIGLISARTLLNEGFDGLSRDFVLLLRKMPFVNNIIDMVLEGEVKGAMKLLADSDDSNSDGDDSEKNTLLPIPTNGISPSDVITILEAMKKTETTAEEGKAFAYTYTTKSDMGDFAISLGKAYELYTASSKSNIDNHEVMLTKSWDLFMHSNALNPMMYPSLRRMETEVISMAAWMVHGDKNCSGALTSGGTESILMAIKCYRDLAKDKKPHIIKPNMIVSTTIHPAFEKAAHYFNVEIIHVGLTDDCRLDINLVKNAINKNTILLIGSAPQYCHGVVDPIEELATLALKHDLPLHVDACFGGFMLPWLEKLGQKIPLWDFRVHGVTSISADIHKYGYSSKGASCLLYRTAQLREYQYFAYSQWPGGLFGSPSLAGSRPGGMIAAAWAAMVGMGVDGYMNIATNVLKTTKILHNGVNSIDGIRLLTVPDMTCLAIVSDNSNNNGVNILAVADIMEEKMGNWKMERQQLPDSLHLSVLPQHSRTCDEFLIDLQKAVNYVREHPETANEGTTGVYGMVAKVPDKGIINSFLKKFFSSLYTLESGHSIVEQYSNNANANANAK
jgi:sphinganine-1-phosphate aldolase